MIKNLKKTKLKTWSAILIAPLISGCFDFSVNVDGYKQIYGSLDLNRQDLISDNLTSPIPNSDFHGQTYLRKHSLSLVATKGDNNHYINAFVLNVFKNEDQYKITKGNSNITDKEGGSTLYNDVKLLIGTSFNQIKDLLDSSINLKNINDQTTNNTTIDNAYKLSLGFMQFPDEVHLASSRNNDYKLYKLTDEDQKKYDTNHNLPKNSYVSLEANDVKLIYTATDLSLNKKLFDFDKQINSQIAFNTITEINQQTNSDVEWVEAYDPSLSDPLIIATNQTSQSSPTISTTTNPPSTKYKFAVDFAVLEITIKQNKQNPDLKRLLDGFSTNDSENGINKLYHSFKLKNDFQTPGFMTGAFHYLKPEDAIDEQLKNAEPILTVNETGKSSPPSIVTTSNWNTYITVSNLGENIEVDHIEDVTANDKNGVVSFYLYLRNKSEKDKYQGIKRVQKTKKHPVVSGFKATLKPVYVDNSHNKQPKEGTPITKWIEAYTSTATYFDQSIYNISHRLWNNQIYNKKSSSLKWSAVNDLDTQFNVVQHNDDIYLGVDSEVLVNDLDFNRYSAGSLVISDDWDDDNIYKNLGLYRGVRRWDNFFSGSRSLGVVTLFFSPYRYDLFNPNNNYSKPSLCDVLIKKSLKDTLVNPDKTCGSNTTSTNP